MTDRRDHVLVLAPSGRDGALICDLLAAEAVPCTICASVKELADTIQEGAAMALAAEEGLTGVSLECLVSALSHQPTWSDFPVLLLAAPGASDSNTTERLLRVLREANLTILERPVRVSTLLSGVHSGLRARRRQYQVRDYLEERTRNEEKLRQTQKLESLGVLAGGVAHDFNNLLTGILGNASLAIECLEPGSEQARSLMEDVVDASERAAHLTRQLLAYAGKGRFRVEAIDVSELVRSTTHLVHTSIPRNATLHLDLSAAPAVVEGDATQIQQVVMNLVINAGEAIPAGRMGEIRVSTSVRHVDENFARHHFASGEIRPGEFVVLRVEDTGEGMDENRLSRIFDPFFTTKFTGRGLGLAAVTGIVRSHKGTLQVRSTPGKGSTFEVFLPVAGARTPDPAPEPKGAHACDPDAKRSLILIVDDEEAIRRTATLTLRHYGYNTIAANGGAEGLRMFEAEGNRVSAVLLDLTMPGLSGEEVFNRLRELRPGLKVVLSSGFSEVEVVRRFDGKGLAGFLQKPYSSGALAAKMKEVLNGRPVLT